MSEELSELKEAERESFEESKEPETGRRSNNWVAGVVLIAIGIIFLISNTTNFFLANWWALFILIPAVTNFNNAWRRYQQDGRLNKAARGSLTGGFILTFIAAVFLFSWDWGVVWPFFLIIGGISALLGGWFD